MYTRILVPTDGSDITAKAVQTALTLAKTVGASLATISVKEPFPYSAISEMQPVPPQEFYDAQERIAASRVKSVVESARAAEGSGSTILDDAALAAVRSWRYRPATLGGKPTPSVRRVRFVFRLE